MSAHSLVQLLQWRSDEMSGKRAYTFLAGGEEIEKLTFSELNFRARAIGARLQQLSARGERAVLLLPPGTEYICAFFGCLVAGTVAVPAYPPRKNRNLQRLEAMLADAQPTIVLTTDTIYRQMRAQFAESPLLAKLTWITTDQIHTSEADSWVNPQVTPDTLAFLQYTSASTSKPKGVMVSHGNSLHNQVLMKEAVRHHPGTVIVSWLPLFHDMGLIGTVIASLFNGVPCYLMSPVEFLKRPAAWLEAIARYRGTFSGAPDFGFQFCVEKVSAAEREKLDLSTWEVAFNSSEPVRAETLQAFAKTFAGCGFRPEALFPCYGLAEHTLFSTGRFFLGAQSFSRSSLEAHRPRRAEVGICSHLVSCGRPSPDARLIIVDVSTGNRCLDGEIGEIWLQSPSVAQGYWNHAEATEEAFSARVEGEAGEFLRTGDLGFLSEGEFYITGRLKDLIIIRGRNLAPQDIEQTVEGCDPAIRPAFVAAVSVDLHGAERLVIVTEVRREARRDIDGVALFSRIRSAVASEYEVDVSAIALLRPGSLPKTSSGKTQRAAVRRGFLAGELELLDQWRDESVFRTVEPRRNASLGWGAERLEHWLADRIAGNAGLLREHIDRDLPVHSYGLDSIVAVSLVVEVETTLGVQLDLDRFFEGEPTLRQLALRVLETTKRADQAHALEASADGAGNLNSGHFRARPDGTNVHRAGSMSSLSKMERVEPVHSLPAGIDDVPSNGADSPQEHPFKTSVNPELGRALAQFAMDKSFVQGEGCWLWDEQGRRYLDFLAQYGALPFGFNPPRIWDALNSIRESGEPSFVQPSYLNAAGELARRLLAAAPPGMGYVTFGNSGAEAVEAAIKLCRSTTGRHAVLAAGNGFHGKTLGALSATDKEKYQKPFGAPVAGFDYVPYGDIDRLRQALSSHRYAAFIVEPIQGEGGIVEPPAGYLRLARKACRETGTLFVADEVQTGLGRTGAMFVCCALGITPDVMTLAKALGGGLIPIGACLSTKAAYNDTFACNHTSTFAGNTLACRAGLATLDLLEENDQALVRAVAENGARLKDSLIALKRRFPGLIGEVRGRGYLLGLRFGLNRHSVDDGLLGYLGEQEFFTALIVSHMLHVEGVRLGYTLNHGGVLRIEPPLTAGWEECQYFLNALERVLARLESGDLAALTSQITGLPLPAPKGRKPRIEPLSSPQIARRHSESCRKDGRFAFLVHPLAWKDYTDLDSSLSPLSDQQLAKLSLALADNFDPFVIGETRIVGKNGKAAYGEFILIPRRADELKAMSHEAALAEIRSAVHLGQKRGAEIVGLGAYTSVVTRGGLSLLGSGMPPLTTGNSYTAIASSQTVRMAASKLGWSLPRRAVAILGAGGAIGQAISVLLSRDAGRLVLLGNPAHPDESKQRLLEVAGRIVWSAEQLQSRAAFTPGSVASQVAELGLIRSGKTNRASLIGIGEEFIRRTGSVVVSVDSLGLLPEVDVVVCCTSTTDRVVREDSLRPSAIVCDVSRPSNVCTEVAVRRPDVLLLDAGVVRLPGDASLGLNISLGNGLAYACMAETMMLAMSGRYCDMSLGFDLPLDGIFEMERVAEELGFQVVLKEKGGTDNREFPGGPDSHCRYRVYRERYAPDSVGLIKTGPQSIDSDAPP